MVRLRIFYIFKIWELNVLNIYLECIDKNAFGLNFLNLFGINIYQ